MRPSDDKNEKQPMTTIFLSGSRRINRINDMIRSRIRRIIDQGFVVVLGDANGADKALQIFLAENSYANVTIFCAGDICRNNVGKWPTRMIDVPRSFKGREFYAQKDKAMADAADYGLVLWDSKSKGSLNNAVELLRQDKTVALYLSENQSFKTLKTLDDLSVLLNQIGHRSDNIFSRKFSASNDSNMPVLPSQGILEI